jgi:asparagine synthetase B (glutamine-hydrolysing)
LESIQDALKTTFRKIQGIACNRPTYVTMSGGLDSTIIACMAQDHIAGVQGITLSIAGLTESEDVQYARRVAQDLRIPLTVITATPQDIVRLLDDVLVWGQDWRDFNVHCGLVNAALGRILSATLAEESDRRPLLLTGDTMNEMVADYEPVRYGDRELYALPQLDWGQRRRFLIAGLDSGDREVGILAKMGFSTIQPYAVAAPAYLRLPSGFLGRPHAKQDVARQMFGARIPQYVLERPKVRAQVASSAKPGGTLAVLMDAGLDDAFLKKRWCELFDIPRESLNGIIRGGVYRCSTSIYSHS